MDNQQLFNLVVSTAGFLAVFVFYQVMQRLQRLEDSKENLPKEFVQKDDYREDIKEVKDILKQIFDKLDGKADK
jgi:antirestriction protein